MVFNDGRRLEGRVREEDGGVVDGWSGWSIG